MAIIAKTRNVELYDTPFHSHGMSLAMWDHSVLPITQQKWTHPTITALALVMVGCVHFCRVIGNTVLPVTRQSEHTHHNQCQSY